MRRQIWSGINDPLSEEALSGPHRVETAIREQLGFDGTFRY